MPAVACDHTRVARWLSAPEATHDALMACPHLRAQVRACMHAAASRQVRSQRAWRERDIVVHDQPPRRVRIGADDPVPSARASAVTRILDETDVLALGAECSDRGGDGWVDAVVNDD